MNQLAKYCNIPVLNALDDWAHPCQIMADFQTICEQFAVRSLEGLKLAFVGDCANNVTYDLMRGGALMGMHIAVAGPDHPDFQVDSAVVEETKKMAQKSGGKITIVHQPSDAVAGADVVYADSIMSYHISPDAQS